MVRFPVALINHLAIIMLYERILDSRTLVYMERDEKSSLPKRTRK
jgi:hypothetical protein